MIDERIVRHEWNGNEETITDIGPLIRCKDCKKRRKHSCPMSEPLEDGTSIDHVPDDWFCADGEPKEGEK